jgi:UDP-N-acetylmuramyl pentapeptide phosphotransferase/UDP-N-acetylglucosamine-1-phosphate transferase
MKIITVVGIILIVVGIVGLIWGGVNYTSSRNAVNLGGMQIEVNETSHIPLSPIAGGVALFAGIVLIVVGRRQLSHGKAH